MSSHLSGLGSSTDPGILRPLLGEALRGDGNALRALMELMATAHYRRIVGFLRKHSAARTQTVEVAFQDSMVRFHELVETGKIQVRGDVLSWMMWFCLRTLRNERQQRLTPAHDRNWSRLSQVLGKLEAQNLSGPATLAVKKEALEELRRIKSELPPRMREVLELHLGGLSADEIAERLRLSPKTVYDLQEKARARVLLLLAPAEETPPPPDRPTPSSRKLKSAIDAAMRPLPQKIREVLDALHGRGLSPRKAASELKLEGPDQVIQLRDEGYRLLSQKLGLPFPESFDYLH